MASKWVIENKIEEYITDITNVKDVSYLIIDDRCLTFNGDYEEIRNKINNFNVWYKK